MPDKWPLANGNWSNAANWNGGTKPVAGDDVFADNRTLNVDENFTVATIRTTQRSGGTSGGTFNFNTAGVTGNATSGLIATTGGPAVTVTATTGTVTLNAPGTTLGGFIQTTLTQISHTGNCDFVLVGTSFTGLNFYTTAVGIVPLINKTSTGTITITGNLIGGGQGSYITQHAFSSTAGNTIINGNVTGGTAQTCHGIIQTAGNVTVNGNVTGGSNNTSHGIILTGGGSITVNGNVTGGSATSCTGVNQTGGVTTINGAITGGAGGGGHAVTTNNNVTVSGSITGGAGGNGVITTGAFLIITGSINAAASANNPVLINSAATVEVLGNVTGGTAVAGINTTQNVTLTVRGPVTAGNNVPAVVSTSTAATNIFTGPFTNTNDTMAVQCVRMLLTQDASTSWNFGNATLFSPERLAFYPSASDIRQGVTYADGTVSGSLAMPPPTAVIAGTPTDNTTGSAVLTSTQLQNAFWGAPLSQMTDTGSIGARLAKSATLDSTGNQLASYLI